MVSSPWRFHARLLELWDEGDRSWFTSPTHPDGRHWDDVALEALSEALDELEQRFGRDPERWRWGSVHGVRFSHPFGEANGLFERIFCRTVEAGGASETVVQNGYAPTQPFTGVWGPVYRMLADVGEPDARAGRPAPDSPDSPGRATTTTCIAGWRDGRSNPAYLDEHELRAAGSAKHLRLEPE